MRRVVATGRIPNQVERDAKWLQAKVNRVLDDAIGQGIFSADVNADNYAGEWMYMYTDADGVNAFKNINTREYIYVRSTSSIS